jgi:hypothetical protein
MYNFEKLMSECDDYHKNHSSIEELDRDYDDLSITWGYTPLETINSIINNLEKPKRIVVFGCSIGYQCFYFNQIYPDLQIIGIDIFKPRIDWGNKMIEKYGIDNVELICDDISNFEIQDGDLIWQNDLLIDDDFTYNLSLFNLKNYDITIVSYKKISTFLFNDILNLSDGVYQDNFGDFFHIEELEKNFETSWTDEQSFYIYYRHKEKSSFDVSHIYPEFIIEEKNLKNYNSMNLNRSNIKLELLRDLYNKIKLKTFLKSYNVNIPETYFYSNKKFDVRELLSSLESFVAKPAHMSESVGVYVKSKNNNFDVEFLNSKMNEYIDTVDMICGDIWWRDSERGFLIEQKVDVVYELKVFVVWGEPLVADLRTSKSEFSRVDFVRKKNSYLNWDHEFEEIKKIAFDLKCDFFRIDFLYDGEKLWASEIDFMPATILPENIEKRILEDWRRPYFKYYYPHLC